MLVNLNKVVNMNSINFKSLNYNSQISSISNDNKSNPITKPQSKPNGDNLLASALIGLAMIGAATLSSCSSDSIIDELDPTEIGSNQNSLTTAPDKTVDMMNTLGILKNGTQLSDIKTFSFTDENNKDYYFEPTKISDNLVRLHSVILKNGDGVESNMYISNTDDGLDVKTYNEKNDLVSYKNYTKQGDEITEYDYIDGFKVQSSKLKKNSDGNIVRTFPNDSTALYSNIKNDEPMPTQINFDIVISPWFTNDNNIEL
jgi:hypothetical protein